MKSERRHVSYGHGPPFSAFRPRARDLSGRGGPPAGRSGASWEPQMTKPVWSGCALLGCLLGDRLLGAHPGAGGLRMRGGRALGPRAALLFPAAAGGRARGAPRRGAGRRAGRGSHAHSRAGPHANEVPERAGAARAGGGGRVGARADPFPSLPGGPAASHWPPPPQGPPRPGGRRARACAGARAGGCCWRWGGRGGSRGSVRSLLPGSWDLCRLQAALA